MNSMSAIRVSVKRVKDPVVRERLLMVHAAQREPLRDVARTFRCVHGKVDYWKKRYERYGLKGLQTKSKSGRPKKITPEQEQKLRRIVRKHNVKHGWKTTKVRQLIAEESGVKYSFRHTIRIVQSWGMSKIKPRPRYAFSKSTDREAFLKKTPATWHVVH